MARRADYPPLRVEAQTCNLSIRLNRESMARMRLQRLPEPTANCRKRGQSAYRYAGTRRSGSDQAIVGVDRETPADEIIQHVGTDRTPVAPRPALESIDKPTVMTSAAISLPFRIWVAAPSGDELFLDIDAQPAENQRLEYAA